jgi:hypothetical protein
LQYRTDAADVIGKDLKELSNAGWTVEEVDDAVA